MKYCLEKFVANCDKFCYKLPQLTLLQIATRGCYKLPRLTLLQIATRGNYKIATGITNCDDSYYKLRQVFSTNCDSIGLTWMLFWKLFLDKFPIFNLLSVLLSYVFNSYIIAFVNGHFSLYLPPILPSNDGHFEFSLPRLRRSSWPPNRVIPSFHATEWRGWAMYYWALSLGLSKWLLMVWKRENREKWLYVRAIILK